MADNIAGSGVTFDRVYSSPLVRASATAKIITGRLKLSDPTILQDLIERNFGTMTGRPISDIEKFCAPDIIKTNKVTYFLSPAGAETFPQLIERAQRVLSWLLERHSNGNILLVCHGDIGKMIYAAFFQLNWADVLRMFDFDNAHLIRLDRV